MAESTATQDSTSVQLIQFNPLQDHEHHTPKFSQTGQQQPSKTTISTKQSKNIHFRTICTTKTVYKSLPRPPQPHSSNNNTAITGPSTTNTNIPKRLITRPLSSLLPSHNDMLSYLSADNSPHILPPAADSTSTTSTSPSVSPATTPNTSRSSSPTLSSPRSSDEESDTPSTSSRDSNTSIKSTASNRQLRPRLPICYNETFLTHLHGRPQVKTLNNISIPLLLVSESEDSSD